MGYEGTIPRSRPTPIRRIPNRAESLIPEVARVIVDDGIDYMLRMVKENTPVSEALPVEGYEHIPGGDGIHLRDEIHTDEQVVIDGIHERHVGSNKPYVRYVEEGTGLYGDKHAKYLISPLTPGGMLRWPGADGHWHFARLVWHPGSPGQHMFLIGGELTERSMQEIRARGDAILAEGMRL